MTVSSLRCLTTCIAASLILGTLSTVAAEEKSSQTDSKGRKVIREDRPDLSRGWIVVSKESYWPLCYESLDRLEEARQLVDSPDELADALDKCGAWLRLSASAAMTDGQSGIVSAAGRLEEEADMIRSGSELSESRLNDLITLGYLSMAKSHLRRAAVADEEFQTPAPKTTTKSKTAPLTDADRQIRRSNQLATADQYLYDTQQSIRHFETAQVYLQAAAKNGGFKLSDQVAAELPEIEESDVAGSLASYYSGEMRPRIRQARDFVEGHRIELKKKLDN